MSLMPEASLIALVRRGELNFERFVEVLSTRGYLTERDCKAGCSLASPLMEAARQADFDVLLQLLMPWRLNDIQLSCMASNEGGTRGELLFVLFNSNVIAHEELKLILVKENEETDRWLAQLPSDENWQNV